MKLSQSVLSSSLDCMLKAQYTLDPPAGVKRVAGSKRAVGTAYHAGLELYYLAAMEGRLGEISMEEITSQAFATFDKSVEVDLYDNTPVDLFKWDDGMPDRDAAIGAIGAMLGEYFVVGQHMWPHDWPVLAVELHGHHEVDGHLHKVGADLLLQDPTGWLVAVDHKTSGRRWAEHKHDPRKNVQAPFYTGLLREMYPDAPGVRFVFDIMTYPNKKGECSFERRIADPEPRHIEAVRKQASTFITLYEKVHVENGLDLPANPTSTLCSPAYCDYWEVCPFGAALDS